jgi:CheY-like chemotaxis protein
LRRSLDAVREANDERHAAETRRQQQRAEELAQANRHKDAWLAMLAHELRNPLTPVRNALHILHLRGGDEKTRQWAEQLLGRQVEHLTRLIEDLLDASRITRGKIELHHERFDLAAVVRTTAEDYRKALETKGLRLVLQLPPGPVWMIGDATRLAQVLSNLLENSSKFTAPGGTITVWMEVDRIPQQATVGVQDTGIGIEPDLLPHIFTSFVQGNQTLARSHGGLGIGLALVKGLVELHGGYVEAASPGPGQGATFTFSLPVSAPESADGQPLDGAAPTGPRLKVLIIEDNLDAAESLKRMLELIGHEVHVVYAGPSGIEAARLFHPDVVICDLGLPVLDGFEVARRLRADPATADVRLIALSGYGTPADRERSNRAGFDIHLTKPVAPETLQRVLAEVPQDLLGKS